MEIVTQFVVGIKERVPLSYFPSIQKFLESKLVKSTYLMTIVVVWSAKVPPFKVSPPYPIVLGTKPPKVSAALDSN